MLRYIYSDTLHLFPDLADCMFKDRAAQFSHRLGWDVHVDENGHERDQYDNLNPLYLIWQLPNGLHGGSMRFLPTTGPVMVNDWFSHLLGGGTIESPFIWECTRFCLTPGAGRRASAALALGAGELMAAFQLERFVGVFDRGMERIYRRMLLEPEVLGRSGDGAEEIGVGLWSMENEVFAPTLDMVGINRETSHSWLRRSLPGLLPVTVKNPDLALTPA